MAYGDLYEDSKTKVPLTAKQTRAIIKDQRAQGEKGGCRDEIRNDLAERAGQDQQSGPEILGIKAEWR